VAVSGGNVYFSGGFGVSATFATGSGNHTVTSNNVPFAGYVLELTSDNQFVGAQVFQPVAVKKGHPPTGWVIGIHLAADSNGNVYAYGNFYGMVSFAGSTSTTGPFVLSGGFNGNGAAYVVKLSPTLTALWAEQFGMATTLNANGVWGTSIAVGGSGNVYLTGQFAGTTNFFGTNLTGAGSGNAFVVKLDTNGGFQWAVSAGGSGADAGAGIAVDSLGNIDVTGYIDSGSTANYSADFDPTHSYADNRDILMTSTQTGFLWQLRQL
jgi:hypothetical protein